MSTISNAAVVQSDPVADTFLKGVGRILKGWWVAYMNWRLQQLAISRLRSMGDRELKDIGISRAQIEVAARSDAASGPMFGRYY